MLAQKLYSMFWVCKMTKKYNKYKKYDDFIKKYYQSENASSGSKYDANANVSVKNVATLNGELYKGEAIGLNRYRMIRKITELYGKKEADFYIKALEKHYVYRHDETNPLYPYCVSASMYPFLFGGLNKLGGISESPKNIQSFCGSFINLIFILSSQFAGACLSRDQELLINKKGITHSISIGDIVSSYDLDRKIINEKDWEVGIVTDDLCVWEDGRYVKVNKVYRRKYDDKIYRIRTKTGKEVKCSKDHKFQVMRGGKLQEVKAEELNLFDTVVNTMDNFRVNKESVEYKNGQLYGIIAGDGCITNNNEVRVSIRYDQEWVSELLDESFLRVYHKKGQLTDGHGAFDYRLCSKDIVSKIREVFLENKRGKDKQIDIKKYSLDFLMGFLDGILLTDGHLDSKTISLSLVNESLIQNVVEILKKVGIELMIKVESAHDNKETLYSVQCPIKTSIYLKDSLRTQTGDPAKLNNLSAGIVDKRGYGIEVGYVGNNYSSHKKNEKDIRLASDLHWNKDFIPDVVCAIEVFDNDDDYVYEIETESHWYSAGGILTHNCATPEFLTYFNYFAELEFGKDYTQNLDKVVFYSDTKKKTVRDLIYGYFQQVIYSINQPASARNFQSVFWNISYFDKYYFESVFENFVFPDGTKPNYDSVKELQFLFMEWFRDERKTSGKELTFPVENACAIDNGKEDFKDQEFVERLAEIWASGHETFFYHSDSADSLASCCFSGKQKVLTKSSANDINDMTFEELYNAKYCDTKKDFKIFHNGGWTEGKIVRLKGRPMYKITTANNKEIMVTDNHVNPTLRGEVRTEDLTKNDYLMFSTLPLESAQEQDKKMTYEQGFLIGVYLGNGSKIKANACESYSVTMSLNKEKINRVLSLLTKATKDITNEDLQWYISTDQYHCQNIKITNKKIYDFISEYVQGNYAYEKSINLKVLTQSKDFRTGIIDGIYSTDGGHSNRIYSTSKKMIEDLEIIMTSLGISSIIDVSDRTDQSCIIIEEEFKRHYPLYCIRFYNRELKRSMQDVYVVKNNSLYFKVKDIKQVEYEDWCYCFEMKNQEEPYFTLPNGIITHNCRLSNGFSDNTFSTSSGVGGIATGSKGVITINFNRVIQDLDKKGYLYKKLKKELKELGYQEWWLEEDNFERFYIPIKVLTSHIQKWLIAWNELLKEELEVGLMPIYENGFISMSKQFLTIGINGFLESAEYLNIDIRTEKSSQ